MILSKTLPGFISSVVLSITALGTSACATANTISDPVDAILLNPQDSPTRQAIRVFVRDLSGPELIASPDSLATNPEMVNHRRDTRNTRLGSNRAFALKPFGKYRLVIDSSNRCWLTHVTDDITSHVELPPSANCAVYKAG